MLDVANGTSIPGAKLIHELPSDIADLVQDSKVP